MELPLVSCIMPTANRQEFLPSAIDDFLKQDYPNTELVIIDDGTHSSKTAIPDNFRIRYFYSEPIGTIGIKRNKACEKSNGEFIIHWDDDDWYAPDWVSKQVQALTTSKADITGLNTIRIYKHSSKQNYIYEDDESWLCGATFAYRKKLWMNYRFADLQIGEDSDFVMNCGGKILAFDYINGFTAGLHSKNTSIRHININHIIIKELLNKQ